MLGETLRKMVPERNLSRQKCILLVCYQQDQIHPSQKKKKDPRKEKKMFLKCQGSWNGESQTRLENGNVNQETEKVFYS